MKLLKTAGRAALLGALKSTSLGVLLVAIAVVGPMVAYAGVSVIYPAGQQTVNVDTAPPITWSAGADHTQANGLGFVGAFTRTDNNAAITLTLSGLSGGTITIDKLGNVDREASVTSWKMSISTALSGTLTAPTTLKLRFWTGVTAPTADNSAGVCAVLDLTAALNTETSAACTGSQVFAQLVYTLPASASGSSTVSIRPTSIVFA